LLLLLLLVLLVATAVLNHRSNDRRPSPAEPVVSKDGDELPEDPVTHEAVIYDFLTPRHGRPGITKTNQVSADFEQMSRELVSDASSMGLDAASLSNVLATFRPTGSTSPTVPIAAYFRRFHGEPVWVVCSRWDFPGTQPAAFGHVRAQAISAKTLKQVGYATCR
jgi:hypothetical protein